MVVWCVDYMLDMDWLKSYRASFACHFVLNRSLQTFAPDRAIAVECKILKTIVGLSAPIRKHVKITGESLQTQYCALSARAFLSKIPHNIFLKGSFMTLRLNAELPARRNKRQTGQCDHQSRYGCVLNFTGQVI